MSFTLTHHDAPSDATVTVYINQDDLTLEEMFSAFDKLLRGAGFLLPAGVHVGFEADDAPPDPP